MPLCQVNLTRQGWAEPGEDAGALAANLKRLAPGTPVILMVHGYKFSPLVAAHDPHRHILSLDPRESRKAVSWPRGLGLDAAERRRSAPEPLCIAVGWEARGTLWQAYGRAAVAGQALARLVVTIRARRPDAGVQAMAHSLGARVVLSALPRLEAGAIERAVLLASAEVQGRAAERLDSPAGRALSLLNVTSGENALFDTLLECLVVPHAWSEQALGRGLGRCAGPGRVDLRIDRAAHRAALSALGHAIPAADRRICHWSVYLRPGLMGLYRDILTGRLDVGALGARLASATAESRAAPLSRAAKVARGLATPLPFPRRGAS